jgi:hypothetical protein
MIIISAGSAPKVDMQTPWGKETGISYLGLSYLLTHTYRTMKEAIAACRKDLDAGLFSIVVENHDTKDISLWCPLPEQLISH